MNSISNSKITEEFEILNDYEDDLDLINENFLKSNKTTGINPNFSKDDKIYEEDSNQNIINTDKQPIININNEINEEINIKKEPNDSIILKKSEKNEDNEKGEEILDFEKIELKEETKGDFTEIIVSSNKSELKEVKTEDQNKLLQSLYQQLNFENIHGYNLTKTCINFGHDNNRFNLIKMMSVLKSTKMYSLKDNIKSFMSTIYYNGYALAKKFDKKNPGIPIYIFDTKIENAVRGQIKFLFKTFLYMSYRSGLVNLNSIGGGDFTSDCGWGCMMRCCQMMLSKGLIQKKINDYFKIKKAPINFNILESIRKETLFLFSDNYLKLKDVKNHPDFRFYWELYKDLSQINTEYKYISEIIPPYSIHILCLLGEISGKYTSDLKMVKLFCKINSQLFPNFNIISFQNGLISKSKLISSFCIKYKKSQESNTNYTYIINLDGIDYIFKKEGIVFITFRFGLNELDSNYYEVIPLLFQKFRNNIGFVSGKKNKAYYFVGIDKNQRLIFFDPHYNQQVNHDIEKDYESYYTENIYLLDIKDLSSELTLGIGIFNANQFIQFLEDLNWFAENLREKLIINLTID